MGYQVCAAATVGAANTPKQRTSDTSLAGKRPAHWASVSRMEPFDDVGTFWLQSDPDRRVGGHLEFDGDAFALTIDGTLRHAEEPTEGEFVLQNAERVVHPVVLGHLRISGEVTLLDAVGFPVDAFFGHVTETWTPRVAILGAAIADPTFGKASFSFDVLVPWVHPPGIVQWESPQKGTIDLTSQTLNEISIGEATVRLTAGWAGKAGGDSLDVHRTLFISVEMPPMRVHDVLDSWVRPVQDLLIVLLGRPVRITEFMVVHQPEPVEGRNPRRESLRVVIGGLRIAPGAEPSWASLRGWGSPTVYVGEELPIEFGELLAGWLGVRENFGESITLLCGPFYAPFMYSEHRYSSTFQSAESIAQAKYAGAEQTQEDHRQRVGAIVEAARAAGVSDDDVAWAERVLRGRNDKPLAQLIDELIGNLGDLGQAVLRKDPNFARTAASARARVAHPGRQGLSTVQRYWYGEVLSWLVRAQLLVEGGLPLDALSARIIDRGNFTQTVEKLEPPRAGQ